MKRSKQMRETRPAHFSATSRGKVECGCGCGAFFLPTRKWQRFKNAAHRKRGWKLGRISARDLSSILARLERLEKHIGIIAVLLLSISIGPVVGWAVDQKEPPPSCSIYAESELVDILKKTFADWQGDKSERLLLITTDGQLFLFGNGGPNSVSVGLRDIIMALAHKGQNIGTVTNILHGHKGSEPFSPTDIALCRMLRKLGFVGEFQIFYPETRRIKTLKREGER